MRCYVRRPGGSLDRADALIIEGDLYLGGGSYPVHLTQTGEAELIGWGEDDGPAASCQTDTGIEVIVPGQFIEAILGESGPAGESEVTQ